MTWFLLAVGAFIDAFLQRQRIGGVPRAGISVPEASRIAQLRVQDCETLSFLFTFVSPAQAPDSSISVPNPDPHFAGVMPGLSLDAGENSCRTTAYVGRVNQPSREMVDKRISFGLYARSASTPFAGRRYV
jgi:hypothetical protein